MGETKQVIKGFIECRGGWYLPAIELYCDELKHDRRVLGKYTRDWNIAQNQATRILCRVSVFLGDGYDMFDIINIRYTKPPALVNRATVQAPTP